jgi:hypothetical protein
LIGQHRHIQEYAGLLLSRKETLPAYSGFVIAGFGEAQALPTLREYMVDIVVDGEIRHWLANE